MGKEVEEKILTVLGRLDERTERMEKQMDVHVADKTAHGLGERRAVESAAKSWRADRRDLLKLFVVLAGLGVSLWPLVEKLAAHIK